MTLPICQFAKMMLFLFFDSATFVFFVVDVFSRRNGRYHALLGTGGSTPYFVRAVLRLTWYGGHSCPTPYLVFHLEWIWVKGGGA